MILDGGPADIGLESTIIDVTEETPVILRPGYIGREALETLLGKVELDRAVFAEPAQGVKPKAPGMKYRHYAPKAEMTLVEGAFAAEAILKEAAASARAGRRTGILCSEETKDRYSPLAEELGAEGFSLKLFCAGRRSDPESIAHRLFGLLRQFDEDGIEVVWAESFDEGGIGTAVMNRLRKAAGYRIMRT